MTTRRARLTGFRWHQFHCHLKQCTARSWPVAPTCLHASAVPACMHAHATHARMHAHVHASTQGVQLYMREAARQVCARGRYLQQWVGWVRWARGVRAVERRVVLRGWRGLAMRVLRRGVNGRRAWRPRPTAWSCTSSGGADDAAPRPCTRGRRLGWCGCGSARQWRPSVQAGGLLVRGGAGCVGLGSWRVCG